MPIIKSAKKRVKQAEKATIRNRKTKRTLKSAIKAFGDAVTGKKDVAKAHSQAQSALDQAGKKNIMHKNKVARKKRQLAKAAKAAGMKPAKTAPSTTKTVTKKSSAKKSPAKKTTK